MTSRRRWVAGEAWERVGGRRGVVGVMVTALLGFVAAEVCLGSARRNSGELISSGNLGLPNSPALECDAGAESASVRLSLQGVPDLPIDPVDPSMSGRVPGLPSFDPLDPSMSGDRVDPELLRVEFGGVARRLRDGLERALEAGDGATSRAYAEVLGVFEPIARGEVDEGADFEVPPVRLDAADGDPAGVVAALDIIRAECRKYYDSAKWGADPVGRRARAAAVDVAEEVWFEWSEFVQGRPAESGGAGPLEAGPG